MFAIILRKAVKNEYKHPQSDRVAGTYEDI